MMHGERQVVSGGMNKLASAVANITPAARLVEQHRKMAEPSRAHTRAARVGIERGRTGQWRAVRKVIEYRRAVTPGM